MYDFCPMFSEGLFLWLLNSALGHIELMYDMSFVFRRAMYMATKSRFMSY